MKVKPDYTTWGDTVRMARHKRRMTQVALGALVGVSGSTIGDIEDGSTNPSYVTVITICAVLDIAEPPALTTEQGEL